MAVQNPLPYPSLPTPPLTDQQKAPLLETLYQTQSLAQFAPYFFLQEFSHDDFIASVGYAMQYPDGDVLIQKFYQYAGSVQMFVRSISAMETGALSVFSGKAQPYQVFVSLDRIALPPAGTTATVLVPYQTAKLLSGAFIQGLVTRLLLDRYKQAWSKATPPVPLWSDLPLVAAPPKGPNPHPVPTSMDAGAWAQKYLATFCANVNIPRTWTNTSSTLGANHLSSDYFGCLNYLSDSSQQAAGIILGWLAGDTITDPNLPPANAAANKGEGIRKFMADAHERAKS